jgi:hypothetical protein
MRDVRYASFWSRALAWLLFKGPFRWVDRWQTNLADAQLKQIFGADDAPCSITVRLILQGRPQSLSAPATGSSPHAS